MNCVLGKCMIKYYRSIDYTGVKSMLYFVVNKKSRSGKGADVWKEVQGALEAKNIEYKAYVTEYEGHAIELAREISEQPDDDICLVVVGGDGTANEVINGMTYFDKVRFGTIPTGSGNDLARGLEIFGTPTENLERILKCMEKGKENCFIMDLGQVSWNGCEQSRLFAISTGMGLDALVCKKALKSDLKDFLNKIHLGKLTYVILTILSLLTLQTANLAVYFDNKGQRNYKRNTALALMNFKAQGGGVKFAPKADATDGKLSACSIYQMSKWRALPSLPFLVVGKHSWIPGFESTDCVSCRVHSDRPVVLHADGEYCGDVTDVTITCLAGKLRVLL